jgi:hypothetical protein
LSAGLTDAEGPIAMLIPQIRNDGFARDCGLTFGDKGLCALR